MRIVALLTLFALLAQIPGCVRGFRWVFHDLTSPLATEQEPWRSFWPLPNLRKTTPVSGGSGTTWSHAHGKSSSPSWPQSYSVKYTFTLPYTAEIQPDMVSYDVAFYRDSDGHHSRVRMEVLNGSNVVIATKDAQYELLPRLDRQVCRVFASMEPGESLSDAVALPDLSGGWENLGAVGFEGDDQAVLWQYKRHHEAKTVSYKMWISSEGIPLRLHMLGNDLFSGAHFDEWVVEYVDYQPTRPDRRLFEPPQQDCTEVPDDMMSATAAKYSRSGAASRMRSVLPMVNYGGDAAYDKFLSVHGAGRWHASLAEYTRRRDIYAGNAAMIQAHNAANRSYTMAMNRFDTRGVEKSDANRHELPYESLTDPSKAPTSVDWRGTGAEGGGVRDQANCGSCWAFGAIGAMESAWWMATGQQVSFSAQQVMDCAWGYVKDQEESASACDGGDAWAGVGHIVEAGGLALAEDYQYLGVGDYCKNGMLTAKGSNATTSRAGDAAAGTVPLVGKFKGYMRLPRYNDAALMEAVYSRGPIAVSLDASQDSFTFYSAGIYFDTACMWKPQDLDHSMMLVGYGSEAGGDYWLVRNSWSTHWGDAGYVKIARDNHGCGAATDALVAVVDAEATAEYGKNVQL